MSDAVPTAPPVTRTDDPTGKRYSLPPVAGLSVTPTTAALTFTLDRQIAVGEGRNSAVFLGTDVQLGATLVYKRIPIAKLGDRDSYYAEARRLHDSQHRHVTPIKYACEEGDHVYLAMPYYEGGSLDALLHRRNLTVRETVQYGLDFLMGVHHAHVCGVIHFDIKPTNVLIDGAGRAAMADFGMSRLVATAGTAEQPSFYEPHAAPERAISNTLTRAADVYQAGLTLYRMCVGEAEWARQCVAIKVGSSKFFDAVVSERFPDRSRFPDHIPHRLKEAIRGALRATPDDRTPTILTLMTQLATVDTCLDWAWHTEPGDVEIWEMNRADVRFIATLRSNGGSLSLEVHRVGRRRSRLVAECRSGLSEGAMRQHLRRFLRGRPER